MSIEELLRHRRREILQIAEKHGSSNVRVFGSCARHEANAKSDVDLLIDLDSGRSLLDQVALKQELEELLGLSVDVVVEGGISPHLEQRILVEALPL